MVTIEKVKTYLKIETVEEDDFIALVLEDAKTFLAGYLNDPELNVDDHPPLDRVVLYQVAKDISRETGFLNRAGLTSKNMGYSLSFEDDFPKDILRLLCNYRVVTFY